MAEKWQDLSGSSYPGNKMGFENDPLGVSLFSSKTTYGGEYLCVKEQISWLDKCVQNVYTS